MTIQGLADSAAAPLRELDDTTKEEAAQAIAARLCELAEGGALSDPSTWRRVAAEAGCCVYEYAVPGAGRGEYAPTDAEAGRGVLAVNTAYEPVDVARAYVHELAHHALCIWRPVLLPSAADGFQYEGDADEAHHDIARRVERMVVG